MASLPIDNGRISLNQEAADIVDCQRVAMVFSTTTELMVIPYPLIHSQFLKVLRDIVNFETVMTKGQFCGTNNRGTIVL